MMYCFKGRASTGGTKRLMESHDVNLFGSYVKIVTVCLFISE